MQPSFVKLLVLLMLGVSTVAAAPVKKKAAAPSLASPNFELRVQAIDAHVTSKDPAAVDRIIPMLKDRDATVRWAAANALDEIHDARALPALEEAAQDPSPLVANRARDAVRAMRGKSQGRIVKLVARDASGAGVPGAEAALLDDARNAVMAQKGFSVGDDATATHLITVTMMPVKERVQGSETIVEVNFTSTVMELPGNQLRFATRVGAAVAGGVPLTAAQRNELVMDAVHSAAAALGEESAGYLLAH